MSESSKAPFARCSECPLLKRPFAPSAPPSKKCNGVALVGESPGANEVRQGIPFVGESGRLLGAVLKSLGLDRREMHVTNAVLCRPKSGEEITQEALDACRNRLLHELQTHRITHVLAMGRHARNALWPDEHNAGITINRGRWRHCTKLTHTNEAGHWSGHVLATAHPAYYLRRPNDGRDFFEDLVKFSERNPLEEVPTEVQIEMVNEDGTNFEQCVHEIRHAAKMMQLHSIVAIDLETGGYSWQADDILNISFSWEEGQAFVIVGHLVYDPEVCRILAPLFESAIHWVGHNIKFDVKFMREQLRIAPKNDRCEDTMMMHLALDERPGTHALKGIVSRIFDVRDYEQEYVFPYLSKKSDSFALVPPLMLAQYAGMDTDYTLRLYHHLYAKLAEEGLLDLYHEILLPAHMVFADMEMAGMRIDWDHVSRTEEAHQKEVDRLTEELRKLARKPGLNPNSPKQLAVVIFDERRLPQPRGRKIKPRSTAHAALEKIYKITGDPFVNLLMQHRKVKKRLSSYLKNLWKWSDKEGYIHPTFNMAGTEVGRISARDPAVQTIPRAYEPASKPIRDSYVASEGHVLLHADYSQMELRVFAVLAQEPYLLEIFREGRDLHTEVAIGMYGEDFTKEDRMKTKMFNFSYLYGGSEYSFAQDAGLPLAQARSWVAQYNQLMPVGYAWKQSQLETMKRQGYVEYPTLRRRRIPFISRANEDDARKACVHAPVAGTASDCNMKSLVRLHYELPEGARLWLTVHDSILVECLDDDSLIHDVARTMKEIMEEEAAEILGDQIPFTVDVDIAYRWGSMTKYDGTWRKRITPWWEE